jgi:hypothetical protein
MLELTQDQIDQMRAAAQAATIQAARAFGFGGDTWHISRTEGNGVTGPVSSAAAADVTGYAYRRRPGSLAPAAPTTQALDDAWGFIVVSGTVQVNDVLTSAADGTIVSVTSVEPWYDYQRCDVEIGR